MSVQTMKYISFKGHMSHEGHRHKVHHHVSQRSHISM